MAKGPNIMKGYYKNEEATREVLTEDGWLLTGDLGYIDKEGYVYITGRKKSVIVTKGGKNIYPEEIEEKLLESPFIEEVLVIMGVHPKSGDEELQAIVFPNYEALDEYFLEKKINFSTEHNLYAFYYRRKNKPVKILTGDFNDDFSTLEELKNLIISNKDIDTETIIKHMLIKMSIWDYE